MKQLEQFTAEASPVSKQINASESGKSENSFNLWHRGMFLFPSRPDYRRRGKKSCCCHGAFKMASSLITSSPLGRESIQASVTDCFRLSQWKEFFRWDSVQLHFSFGFDIGRDTSGWPLCKQIITLFCKSVVYKVASDVSRIVDLSEIGSSSARCLN